MRAALTLTLTLSLVLLGGCRERETGTAPTARGPQAAQTSLSPEQLGELGAQIQKEPNRANEILSAHGLNEQSFEAEIRRVTQDPDASRRYSAAFNKSSA